MFWGLVLKANKKYTQTIKNSFHLSQAALDVTACGDEPVQVFLTSDNEKYLICTLRKAKTEQVALDLNFQEGDVISFHAQGSGNVHLSGYVMEDEPSDLDFLDEEESETEDAPVELETKKKPEGKKQKGAVAVPLPEEDDDESDDSDFDVEQADEEDDGEEEEEEDDDEVEEADSDSDEEVPEPKAKQPKMEKAAKQNGLENGKVASKEKAKKEKKPAQAVEKPQKGGEKTIQGGVKIEDVRVGTGAEAKPGKKVQVYYEGRLKTNNKVFDSTKQGAGFKFSLGRGEVIKAWDVGVSGMKVGGKRRIVCPPHMAYGARGSPPVIPPNSTLVFEVELKNVN